MIGKLLKICDILGVFYDVELLRHMDDCASVEYLLEQIYKYLGGK